MGNSIAKRIKVFGVDILTLTQFWRTKGPPGVSGSPLALQPDSCPGQGPGLGSASGYGSHHWPVSSQPLPADRGVITGATRHLLDPALLPVSSADNSKITALRHVQPGRSRRDSDFSESEEESVQGGPLHTGELYTTVWLCPPFLDCSMSTTTLITL